MFYGISVDATCPAGFKHGSATAAFQGGSLVGALSTPRDGSVDAVTATGLRRASNVNMSDVEHAGAPNPYVNNKALSALPACCRPAPFEIRYYCTADTPASLNLVTDKWFTLNLDVQRRHGCLVGRWPGRPGREHHGVAHRGCHAVRMLVTLDGTVKNAAERDGHRRRGLGAVLRAAEHHHPGRDRSRSPAASRSTTLIGSADGYHQYTAKFVSTDTASYNSSALSGTASVIIGSNTAQSTITVVIPNNVGALILSGVPASVRPRYGGAQRCPRTGTLDASGNLNGVTVTDTRQLDFPAWSLTGQVGDFS